MSKTEVSGKQIKDGSIELLDLAPAVSGDINDLKSDVSTLQSDVATLQVDVSANSSDVSGIDGRVNFLETDSTTKSYVDQQISNLISNSPSALNTLNELATALGSDPNFATTVAGQIGDVASDVAALDTRVTTAEGDISTLQSDVSGKASAASLATVATSGSYNDLADKPSLFSGSYIDLTNKPSLATVATSGAYSDLSGAPSLATVATSGSYNDLADKPSFSSDLDGLTDVTITSATNGQVLQYNGTAWVNGAAPSTFSGSYTDLTNKPTIPSALDDLSDVAVTSAAKGQFIVHNGTQFVNLNTIEASGAAVKPLIVKGAASQTANLLEVQNSSGTALLSVSSAGVLSNAVDANTLGATTITTTAAATKALVVKAASSQSANIFEAQNSSGTALFTVSSTGSISIKASNSTYMGLGFNSGDSWSMYMGANNGGVGNGYNLWIGPSTGQRFTSGSGNSFNTAIGAMAMFGVSGASGSGNVAMGYRSGYTLTGSNCNSNTLIGTQAGYSITSGSNNVNLGYNSGYNITTGASNVCIGYGADAAASASNSIAIGDSSNASGDYAVAIGKSASAAANCMDIRFGNATRISGDANGQIGINETTPGAQLQVTSGAAARKALIVKGAASQSANLFEAQNSSGTVLFSIDSAGSVAAGTVPVARVSGLATVATSGSYNDLSNKPSGLATETYVDNKVAALVASAPAALDTLNELATALGNDANFSTTMTNALAAKANTSSLATVATSGAYSDLSGAPSLATVATSGSYADLSNKPTLASFATLTSPASGEFLKYNGTAWVNSAIAYSDVTGTPSLATVATSGSYADLTNKPSLATVATSGSYNDLADKPTVPDSSKFSVGASSVDTTFNGITSKETNVAATTTDATETTLFSLTLADNTTYNLDVMVCARLSSTTAKGMYGRTRLMVYRNNAGSATIAADFGGQLEELDSYGTSGYDYVVDVSGNDVRVRVTGAASETVKWAAHIKYVSVS